ncbi:hypothetical protein LBMAG56_18880 [Verrucomicrobiota bacterium]|nr:hypothetical protein LBMAG56_18880 [Verrucomicrobiota bacterium]
MSFQAALKMGEDAGEQARRRWFEGIVNPFARLPRPDQTSLTDDLKMGGQRGLRDAEGITQLANAQFPATQSGENAHSRRVGEGFGGQHQFIHAPPYVSAYADMFKRCFRASAEGVCRRRREEIPTFSV